MGRHELLEALQREGQEKMAAMNMTAAAEEERLRTAAEQRRLEILRMHEAERDLHCSNRQRTLVAKAAREAALISLRAEHALALRLHEHARRSLVRLNGENAARLLSILAAELPPRPWQRVWTTPAESVPAALLFPNATIIADPALSGGLKAATADQSLTVDNTLETRLERLWPDLLPVMIEELRSRSQP